MTVDHERPLPIEQERLEWLAHRLYALPHDRLDLHQRRQVLKIGLAGEQVEAMNDIRFFLSEAYQIYNARFR